MKIYRAASNTLLEYSTKCHKYYRAIRVVTALFYS